MHPDITDVLSTTVFESLAKTGVEVKGKGEYVIYHNGYITFIIVHGWGSCG